MSRAPRTDGDGEKFTFTKIYDVMAAQLGMVSAAVYGVVHRHCQMREGVCRASTRHMAELLGTNHVTVQRHLRKLVKTGFLEDLTPGQRGKPHTYCDTYLPKTPPRSARPYPRPEE